MIKTLQPSLLTLLLIISGTLLKAQIQDRKIVFPDIHGLIDWQYEVPLGGHRPVTLVFAREKTIESAREALLDRRTVVWFNNTLIGREQPLLPLIQACLSVKSATYQEEKTMLEVAIENHSDAEFLLDNQSDYTFHSNADVVRMKPNDTTTLLVKTIDERTQISLPFIVLNAITAPETHPEVVLEVKIGQ